MTRKAATQPGYVVCTRCEVEKLPSEFHAHPLGRGGVDSNCKTCKSEISRERRKNPDLRERERWQTRLRRYGITEADYNEMLLRQGGKCAICLRDPNGLRKHTFHVDHDHETGIVRGLLCWSCNVALGALEDDPARLQRAITYLEVANAESKGVVNGKR